MTTAVHRFDGSVYGFRAKYGFLSNFAVLENPIVKSDPKGNIIKFPTVEHFYMAMKTTDWEERKVIAAQITASAAKAYVEANIAVRDNWDDVKIPVMWHGICLKFSDLNPALKQKLLDTGDRLLIEANRWNDRHFGVDWETGEGENVLGRLLMKRRNQLRELENG
ncbi:GTP cyclohydrolase II [Vibrio phage C-ZP2022]|nr:GTP cyclohydrolase II [Vibrio phage C-ZP2022]